MICFGSKDSQNTSFLWINRAEIKIPLINLKIQFTPTVAGVNPTVNLSVSSNSGSEAAASSAVTGDQTVTLGVSGTNITAGDYNLTNTTITILSGQTTGSTTFTIVDDPLDINGTEANYQVIRVTGGIPAFYTPSAVDAVNNTFTANNVSNFSD